jgi:hypothetical protein
MEASSIHCVEIFLPLQRGDGEPAPPEVFTRLKQELTDRFGGVTAFTRAPAEGRWQDGSQVVRDEIVVFEVMTPKLDGAWWRALRGRLETELGQSEILIRSHVVTQL